MREIYCYIREVVKLRKMQPDTFDCFRLLHYYPAWRRSRACRSPALEEALPWVTFDAQRFLISELTTEMDVFEWGSGGSTLFFSRAARHIVSIEHDPQWARKVAELLARYGWANTEHLLVEPELDETAATPVPSDPALCHSSLDTYRSKSFHKYAAQIDRFRDAHFDVVLVDGRARPSCALRAIRKIKTGGLLVLDNAERPHYGEIHRTLLTANWKKMNFCGPGACGRRFCSTCV